MNQQQIYDRVQALSKALADARREAGLREMERQAVERFDLQVACAAKGHVFIEDPLFGGWRAQRHCAFCLAFEVPLVDVTSSNLTRGG